MSRPRIDIEEAEEAGDLVQDVYIYLTERQFDFSFKVHGTSNLKSAVFKHHCVSSIREFN